MQVTVIVDVNLLPDLGLLGYLYPCPAHAQPLLCTTQYSDVLAALLSTHYLFFESFNYSCYRIDSDSAYRYRRSIELGLEKYARLSSRTSCNHR